MSRIQQTHLSPAEERFYSRHLILPAIGRAGQERLKNSSVLIVGLGGLGSPLALYLAAAGVGRIGICDFDLVEETNLHRQILYGQESLGQPKIEVGTRRLRDLNPHIEIFSHPRFSTANARDLVRQYDLVADGADNFSTRYLVNDACVLEKRPLVSASISEFEGQLSIFCCSDGPCYRCLFPQPPPSGTILSCAEAGVLGVLPGVMGTLQATEVIKFILNLGTSLKGVLLCYDALGAEFSRLNLRRDPTCPVCGERPTIREVNESIEACDPGLEQISVEALREKLKGAKASFVLVDVREESEVLAGKIEGSISIPLKLVLDNQHQLQKGDAIVLYCQSGLRSTKAQRHLLAQGFTHTQNLVGGYKAWLTSL